MATYTLDKAFTNAVLRATGAGVITSSVQLQELWSGYGHILRLGLEGAGVPSVVVKHVTLPKKGRHPAGWNTDLGHKRKLKSYRVETAWYGRYAGRCTEGCRVPRFLALKRQGDEVLMILEDLDTAGYPDRRRGGGLKEAELGLAWLANFHAAFMGEAPEDLWKNGTYWHLDTRPDELKVMPEGPIRQAAGKIDMALKQAAFRTFVHGDAKLANFNFSRSMDRVAAVDFQYVGGGCGMVDVVYFLSSCLYERDIEQQEESLLAFYFRVLREALIGAGKTVDADALETEWRSLYPVAWADMYRFLLGWGPSWTERGGYGERLSIKTAERLLAGGQG